MAGGAEGRGHAGYRKLGFLKMSGVEYLRELCGQWREERAFVSSGEGMDQ